MPNPTTLKSTWLSPLITHCSFFTQQRTTTPQYQQQQRTTPSVMKCNASKPYTQFPHFILFPTLSTSHICMSMWVTCAKKFLNDPKWPHQCSNSQFQGGFPSISCHEGTMLCNCYWSLNRLHFPYKNPKKFTMNLTLFWPMFIQFKSWKNYFLCINSTFKEFNL